MFHFLCFNFTCAGYIRSLGKVWKEVWSFSSLEKSGKKYFAVCLYGKRKWYFRLDLFTCILIIIYSDIFYHIVHFNFIVLTIIVPVFDLTGVSFGKVKSEKSPEKVWKCIFKIAEEPCMCSNVFWFVCSTAFAFIGFFNFVCSTVSTSRVPSKLYNLCRQPLHCLFAKCLGECRGMLEGRWWSSE